MTLESLTYMSTAVHPASKLEIDHLLVHARARNASLQVTGVLLYSEGSFLQCIEGAVEDLDMVFEYICADPLHHHIFELLRDPIDTRDFAEWSMAYRATGADSVFSASADHLSDLLSAPDGILSPSRHLLSAFWNGGLGTRYQAAIAGHRKTAR